MDNYQNYGGGGMPYPPYRPYEQMYGGSFLGAFAPVSPAERSLLKRHYRVTFTELIVHTLGSLITAQIVFIIMGLCGYEFRRTEEGASLFDAPYNIAGSLVPILFSIGLYIFDRCRYGKNQPSYFETQNITFGRIVTFFGIIMLAYPIAYFIQYATVMGFYVFGYSPIAEKYMLDYDVSKGFLISEVIFTAFLAPIAEELFFRGVVLRRLCSVSQRMGIFMSALIFGLMHGNLMQAELGFVIGLVWGYAAVRTGSLILPIMGHIFINSFVVANQILAFVTDDDTADKFWAVMLGAFFVIGLFTAGVQLIRGKYPRLPKSSEYHRKRTFPIIVTSVPFWILTVIYIIDIVSKFGAASESMFE